MKRIRIVLLSGFLFILLLLSGCVTKEQEEKNAANLARAEINAVNYVKEKYGFTAEITSSEIERDGGMFGPSFTNHAYVNMSYNGKDFTVYINGKNTNTDGVDDYQAAAITEALQAKLDSIVGHDSVYILSENFYRKPDSDSDSGYGFYFNEYFNGENLSELSDETNYTVIVNYEGNVDLSALTEEVIREEFGKAEIYAYSYTSDFFKDSVNDRKLEAQVSSKYEFNSYCNQYAMYLNEAVGCFYDFYLYNVPVIHNAYGFSYLTADNEPIELVKSEPHSIAEWDEDYEFCTDMYLVPDTVDELWIYFDKAKLNGENYAIAEYYTENGEENFKLVKHGEVGKQYGDYMVFNITVGSCENFCFGIVNEASEK